MKTLLEYLKKLGLTNTEAKIYLILLQDGPLPVAQIAKEISINRTAVYPYITSLVEKGILAEITHGSRKQFVAAEPERLQYIIERKLESLKYLQTQFPQMLTTIHTSFTKQRNTQKIENRYYKGKNGAKAIYEESFKAKEIRTYINLLDGNALFSDNINVFNNALRQNPQLRIKEIFYNVPHLKNFLDGIENHERYTYKFLPKDVMLNPTDILIYDNKVAVINVSDKKNITGVVMQNPDYYANSKELFDLMWKMLPEPSKD